MGQKTNPIGFRLGIVKQCRSRWYATKEMPALLKEDELLRKYLKARLGHAAIADIDIERKPGKVVVTVHTGRPGRRDREEGRRGRQAARRAGAADGQGSRRSTSRRSSGPSVEAQLVGDNIAHQLAQRISFRRAMKRAVQSAMRMGAQGIKVQGGGRLGGAEIARSRAITRAGCPLHTLRADIDYATSHREDDLRHHRVKVWIFKGEMIEDVAAARTLRH